MHVLGLTGMAAAYRQLAEQDNTADLSRDEWLGLMLDRETAMLAPYKGRCVRPSSHPSPNAMATAV